MTFYDDQFFGINFLADSRLSDDPVITETQLDLLVPLLVLDLLPLVPGLLRDGAKQRQQDGKRHEAVKQSKQANQEEDLKEGEEDIGLGGGQQNKCQEGREASVEDCWSYLRHRADNSLVPVSKYINDLCIQSIFTSSP